MIGHRLIGHSFVMTGNFAEGRAHYDQVIALYDPREHRTLATRFGQDVLASILPFRALALWANGYPDAALADAGRGIKHSREIDHAASLMLTMSTGSMPYLLCGRYTVAKTQSDEIVALAGEKGGHVGFKAIGMMNQGLLLALTGRESDAIHTITSGIEAWRSNGGTLFVPIYLSYLARTYAELGLSDDARRSIGEASALIQTTKETWCEAELHRIAGEIALKSPELDAAKAQAYFERALAVARQQQAKSWELRAAMSMARLWRDQSKVQQAHELLAPVYGWFTEGFDTRDCTAPHPRSLTGQSGNRQADVYCRGRRSCLPYWLSFLKLFSVRFGGLPPAGRSKRALKLT